MFNLSSVLLIVIVVFQYSSFESSYVLLISFSLFKGVEVKHGGGGGGIFSCLAYFSKSSCISNSDSILTQNLFDLIHLVNFYQDFWLQQLIHCFSLPTLLIYQ